MNFLLDAHLPRRLAFRLREWGHDAIHTLDLANLETIINGLEVYSYVELSRSAVILHF